MAREAAGGHVDRQANAAANAETPLLTRPNCASVAISATRPESIDPRINICRKTVVVRVTNLEVR
jgi:hypothetical protein